LATSAPKDGVGPVEIIFLTKLLYLMLNWVTFN